MQRGTNSLRPVTIRQVLNASQPHSDAPFVFDDAELSQVSLVAWIRSINRNTTNVQYTLDDGTGQIDVRQWVDHSLDEGGQTEEFTENQFVRILGEIKSFNNKRSITAASVAVIEDHNEYLFHQLEVIQAHLALLKGGSVRLTCLTHIQTSKVPASSVEASAYNDAALNSADPMATDLSHLTPLQRKIYQAIAAEAPDWPEGVDIQQVFQRCKNTDPAQVQDAIDELANDGYIYQASDETHYLTTAG
ncbi:rfa2-dna replication factor 36 kda subunit [Malassezia pachydermatis]|uniref:Rfa2-dna replication factor 36 kDa subunit n=1 Tax=Malassezia pachydermatis TaxID=77020 RepID=A0A0M9VQT5_9BASI|nr:rfa2-dna replication factor 36 kda subunit [Malassezia pachydermatis]KOS15849.1 rfa2-dna replication factor 36 kda subunit [Malassezia pachydermatis]